MRGVAEPELIPVYVTTAVRTSAGQVPGPESLPAGEAAALVRDRVPACRAPR